MKEFYNLTAIDNKGKFHSYSTDYLNRYEKKKSAWIAHGWSVKTHNANGMI